MASSPSAECRHTYIESFDGVRCCLACGLALLETPPASAIALSRTNSELSWKQKYGYEALNYDLGQEIRLIVLYPGEFSDDIKCDIIHVNLLDNPRYEAISYTWADEHGDDTPSSKIFCPLGKIHITTNCEAALRRLRRRTKERTIWVDSICIDQDNISERNRQVELMTFVYAKAVQVVVYLGEASCDSDKVFNRLAQGRSLGNIQSSKEDQASLEGFDRLISRPWFQRVWVIQEVMVSQLVLVLAGEKHLDWSAFSIDRLLRLGFLRSEQLSRIPGVLKLASDLKHKTDFLTILTAARTCSATDPRDKIFALLGLTDEHTRSMISPDYKKSKNQLFIDVAIYLARNQKCLDVLSCVEFRELDSPNLLPSWVPDWSKSLTVEPFPTHLFLYVAVFLNLLRLEHREADQHRHTESQQMLQDIHVPDITSCFGLKVRAHEIAMIERVLPSHEEKELSALHRLDLEQLWTYVADPQARPWSYKNDGLRGLFWDVVARYILLRLGQRPLRDNALSPYASVFGILCREHLSQLSLYSGGKSRWGGILAREPIDYFHKACDMKELRTFMNVLFNHLGEERKLFVTGNSLGIGPPGLRSGDIVWNIDGAKADYVLRKVEEHYVLVGECYLHRDSQRGSRYCKMCGDKFSEPIVPTTETIEIR